MSHFLSKIKSKTTSSGDSKTTDMNDQDDTTSGLLQNLPKTYTSKLAPLFSYVSGNPSTTTTTTTNVNNSQTLEPNIHIHHHHPPLAGISRIKRKVSEAAEYLLELESFSSEENLQRFYHISKVFEAGGNKWRLCLYPNRDKENNGSGYLSLYLIIVDTDAYPLNWEVHVTFKFFLFDKKHDQYLVVQDVDNKVRRFHEGKVEWGFTELISHEDFYNPSNGFLVNDSCIFGAEVVVLYHSILKIPSHIQVDEYPKNTFTWVVKRFPKRKNWKYIESEVFVIGDLVWTLLVYPRGYDGGKCGRHGYVSLCLHLHSQQEKRGIYGKEILVEYKMIMFNQDKSKHLERSTYGPIGLTTGTGRWEEKIINLKDLLEDSKGFIKNDTLTIQVQVSLPV